jgi:hypothetical protein
MAFMSPCHSMRRLREVVSVVLQTTKHGGKLLQRDESTLILTNYNVMNMHALDIIREQFPHSEINIQAEPSSSSGYVVIFVLNDQANFFYSSACFQMSCLVLITMSMLFHRSVYSVFFTGFI